MSSVDEQTYDDQVVVRYLLGLLPEDEAERLDELSIADDAFVGRLRAVENDLVDSYARGELSGETLDRFRSFYSSSAKRRDKVSFATVLQASASRSEATGHADDPARKLGQRPAANRRDKTRLPKNRFSFFIGQPLRWGLAAAVLLLLVGAGWLQFENLRLRTLADSARAQQEALELRERELQSQLAERRSLNEETEQELARVRERLALLEQQQQRRKGEPEPRDLNIVAFTFSAPTRGGQITTIAVPAATDYVALRLELDSGDFPAYQAALKIPGTNQIIWRSARLKARTAGNAKAVSVSLRAGTLKPQTYALELTGIPPTGAAVIIGSYPFRVVLQ